MAYTTQSEYFLHYIWRTHQFDLSNLLLSDGRKCEIIDFGSYNTDSGPDFLHGRIRIDNTILAGHIELHNKSSEWIQHKHHLDKAYNNVILHVVGDDDCQIKTQHGQQLATLAINRRIAENIRSKFQVIQSTDTWIPCQNLQPGKVPDLIWSIWKERLNIERIQKKLSWLTHTEEIASIDWVALFYRQLFRAFGTNVNREAFDMLAGKLDYRILLRNIEEPEKVFALIFGVAGFLENSFKDVYPNLLKETFSFIKYKYKLSTFDKSVWKYARMHPPNFPDIRLAQLASLITKKDQTFTASIPTWQYDRIMSWLDIDLSDSYWGTHNLIDHFSIRKNKGLSKEMKHLLIINAFVPIMFLYGRIHHQPELQEEALNILFSLPSEKNKIIQNWQSLDVPVKSAGDSQALLRLKKEYCDKHQCLRCSIGHTLISQK